MSQRSHIAKSGSSEMSACSAAWSAETSVGITSIPSSRRGAGTEPDAFGLERRLRQLERRRVDHAAVRRSPCAGRRPPARRRRSARSGARRRRRAACAQRLDDRGLRLLPRLRVPVDRDGPDERRPRLEVERRDAVLLAEVEVDGALVDRRERALALREYRAPLPSPRRRSRRSRDRRSGASTRAAGVSRPRQTNPAGVRSSSGRSAARSSASGPEDRRVALGHRPLVGGGEHVPVEDPRRTRGRSAPPRPSARAAPRARS